MSALTKLIDFLGLTAQTEELVDAMDAKDADNLQAAKSYADTVAAAAGSSAAASSIPLSQKGTPGGVAELNSQGIVPSHQLPSFVDDVIEGYRLGQHFYSDAAHTTIVTDETGKSSDQLSGKIYVDLGDNRTYRWAGSDYAVISESLALGTTEATAGRGDWTYTAYQHSLAKGSQFASNLYKITTNAEGHVIAATPVTKQDIVDLGIPGSDTVYEDATTTTHGLMSASDKAKLDGVEAGAQVNPGDATQSTHGLMSATDKAKLDGIEANANNYSLPTMSPTTKGGAKVGHGLSVEDDALNLGPLTDSGSGASVQTDGCGIFGVSGEGFAEQDTTTGKNLLRSTLAQLKQYNVNGTWSGSTYTWNGITFAVNADMSITISGTATSDSIMYIVNDASAPITLPAGTYTLSKMITSVHLRCYENHYANPMNTQGEVYKTHTLPAQRNFVIVYIHISSGQSPSGTIYPMIEANSTMTPYEPYTGGKASPNPDYPQEIRVARGRNLLDMASIFTGEYYTINSDGSIKINSNDGRALASLPSITLSAGTYTFSKGESTTTLMIRDVTGGIVGNYIYYDTPSPCTFTLSESKSIAIKLSASAFPATTGKLQLELGTQATPYVPYGHIGLDITANGQTTTTPIPLPTKGFAGALPDGTKDTLAIDSAGRVEWVNATKFTTQAVTDGVSGTVGVNVLSTTGQIVDGATVLYAPTPTTEHGYIALPELPAGATVSIPELEAIGVEWWVEGAGAIAEHGRNVSKANKETSEEQLFKSVVLTGYSGSITETALYALHAELGTKSCLFNLSIDGVIYAGMQQGENVNAYSIMLFNNEKYIYAGYSHINSWTIKTISTI